MKSFFIVVFLWSLSGCGMMVFQQPLPNSLWGEWAIELMGTAEGSISETYRYGNRCPRYDDTFHFSSDRKLTLRWRDESCMTYYYKIGTYRVDKENRMLYVDLEETTDGSNRPFPPITQFKIEVVNETTLKLKEMKRERVRRARRGEAAFPASEIRLVFRKLET